MANLNPKLNGEFIPIAKFTKVETGSDGFAADFAKSWVCPDGFGLQTEFDSELKDSNLQQRNRIQFHSRVVLHLHFA